MVLWVDDSIPLLAIIILGVLVVFVRAVLPATRAYSSRAPLPPGPRTSWYGHVDLPKAYQWRVYADWKALYGDVIYIQVFGNPIMVLNSAEAINDLFEKRSAIYSSRPHRTMVHDLIGFDWLFSTMPYGSWWKRHRAMFQQYFSPSNISIKPVIAKEVDVFLCNLSHTPENLFYHTKRTAAAIPMMLSYGHQIAPEGDLFVSLADEGLQSLARAGIFGTYIVDYLNFLKYIPAWVPGASFKKQATEWRRTVQEMINRPFQLVKSQMAAGVAVPCFATSELERISGTAVDSREEELIRNVAAISYAAGVDTAVNTILSFFLAVMVYPEVQAKAQAEIDRVIGRDRLPTLDDRQDLPYIERIVWESLRWNPVTPMGIARSVMEDDEYRGYRIPKGTTVLPNVWAILHDERAYPNPMKFDPDRFADEEGNRALGVNEIPSTAFGFGRRICPGRWLATDFVWLTVATVMAAFNVEKPCDVHGRPVDPDTEYTPTLLSGPKPFQCSIVPRSDAALALVRQNEESQ